MKPKEVQDKILSFLAEEAKTRNEIDNELDKANANEIGFALGTLQAEKAGNPRKIELVIDTEKGTVYQLVATKEKTGSPS